VPVSVNASDSPGRSPKKEGQAVVVVAGEYGTRFRVFATLSEGARVALPDMQ
jgi:hypothetical protein